MIPVSQSKNVMPRGSRSQDAKPWQKLAIARAAQATLERAKTDTIGRDAYALRSFQLNCDIIVKTYPSAIPFNCTAATLCQDGLKIGSCLTGKQVWSSWDTLSREIENEVIPMFIRSGVLNADNSIPSGVQLDDIFYRFRQFAFDHHFNGIIEMAKPTAQSQASDDSSDSELELAREAEVTESEKKKRGRKKKVVGTKKAFEEDWFPNWWLAFTEHGPLSNRPILGWTFTKLSGGPDDNEEDIAVLSRKEGKNRMPIKQFQPGRQSIYYTFRSFVFNI
jgi:hypothetical protein